MLAEVVAIAVQWGLQSEYNSNVRNRGRNCEESDDVVEPKHWGAEGVECE